MFLPPAVLFFGCLVDLVYEKEQKLRVGMRQMGLRTSAYWAAWVTYALSLAVASTAITVASGYAIGFAFFRNANVGAVAVMFFSFAVCMEALAFLLSALLSTSKAAQTVSYSVIIVGMVFQFILTSGYAALVDLLYSDDLAPWVAWVRRGLQLWPAYTFSLFFYDISALSSSTYDPSQGKMVTGPGFAWSDMFSSRTRDFAGFHCVLPAPAQSLGLQLLDTVVFAVLALYLDAVLPGPHGTPAHPLFFLGCRYRPPKLHAEDRLLPGTATGSTALPFPSSSSSSSSSSSLSPPALLANGEPPALAALRSGAVDSGVSEEAAFAERTTTASLADLVAATRAGGPDSGPESTSSSAGRFAAADAASAAAVASLPLLRVSHLRVVYRKGWSAALYALTGIDASRWVASRGGSSGGQSSCWGCCRGNSRISTATAYAPLPGDAAAADSPAPVALKRAVGIPGSIALASRSTAAASINASAPDAATALPARNGSSGAAAVAGGPAGRDGMANNSTSSGDVLAVNDLSFTVRCGEILALLGHNGCGKSSTISSLTGLFTPAAGIAEIAGLDTRTQLAQVQRVMGVCPQHDILWPALTAEETLRLFAAVKGVPPSRVNEEVSRVLLEVRLASVRHRSVGGFSGGMKRRLSVAIAALGSPAVIFLDEVRWRQRFG